MAYPTAQSRPAARAHPLARAAGFALLQPASKPDLDGMRILTMSGTLAINLIAMGLLMMPLAMPPPAAQPVPKLPGLTIRQIPVEPVVVEIVPVVQPPAPHPATAPVIRESVAPPASEASSTAVLSETGTEQASDSATGEETAPAGDSLAASTAAPAAIQLQYLSAPAPSYPRSALQRRIEGTVLLQVLVGIDGRPLQVTVAQSSGSRMLDDAARDQILKRWRFRPAMKDGQVVQATGLVPVAFNLRR